MPTLTEAGLKAKFKAYGPRQWDQLCQAAVRQACAWTGGAPAPNYLSADQARHASKLVSKMASEAPLGAVHYWAIGTYGHVAGGLGGARVFMASRHSDGSWGTSLGVTTVDAYTRATGATYLGWARSNGHNKLSLRRPASVKPTPPPPPAKGRTYTTARAGEGFIRIGERTGVSVAVLGRLNPKLDGSNLAFGARVYTS